MTPRPRASRHLGRRRPSSLGAAPWGDAICWALLLHLAAAEAWGWAGRADAAPPAPAEVRSAPLRRVSWQTSARERPLPPAERPVARAEPAPRPEPPERPAPAEPAPQDPATPAEVAPARPVDARTATARMAAGPRRAVVAVEPVAPAPADVDPDADAGDPAPDAAAPVAEAEAEAAPPARNPPAPEEAAPPPPAPPSTAEPRAVAENATPGYPLLAVRHGWEGRVTLAVEVTAAGAVSAVSVAASSGVPLLDATARRSVAGWRFEPALRDGRPVPGRTQVRLRFELRDRAVRQEPPPG